MKRNSPNHDVTYTRFQNLSTPKLFSHVLFGGLAFLLVVSSLFLPNTAELAHADNDASVAIGKRVNGVTSVTNIRPGDTLQYRVQFRANDSDADGPVEITDVLPIEFAGWRINSLTGTLNGSSQGVTLQLAGVTTGTDPAVPVNGTVSTDITSETNRTIKMTVARPVIPGVGNSAGTGLPLGEEGVLIYNIEVPANLSTSETFLNTPLVNTATIDAKAGRRNISATADASATITNPAKPQISSTKTWVPEAQAFIPDAASDITLGAEMPAASGVTSVTISDPDSSGLIDGATSLPDQNPFNFVNFNGFQSAPTDPGVFDSLETRVYLFNDVSSTWSWQDFSGITAADYENIGGVEFVYSTDTPITTAVSITHQFEVSQRETNRKSGTSLATGWSVENTALVTALPADSAMEPGVSSSQASFAVILPRVDIVGTKFFYSSPNANPEPSPNNRLDAVLGDTVGVIISATNRPEPYSSEISTLTITEPGTGSSANFFGENLTFTSFDAAQTRWPTGATSASLIWTYADSVSEEPAITIQAPTALPAPDSARVVTGFTIEFTGPIAPGAIATVAPIIETNPEYTLSGAAQDFANTALIVGTGAGDLSDTERPSGTLRLAAPKLDISASKRIGPSTVVPGQSTYVQIESTTNTNGPFVKADELTIEDSLPLAPTNNTNFWQAFNLTHLVPPFDRPLGSDGTTQTTLIVELRNEAGDWSAFTAFNPNSTAEIPVPADTTGVRYKYTNSSGVPQVTNVKVNLKFQARTDLRSGGDIPFGGNEAADFTNTAQVSGGAFTPTGPLPEVNPVNTSAKASIRDGDADTTLNPNGDGLGGDKAWSEEAVTAQSNANVTSTQRWLANNPNVNFTTVFLQEPAQIVPPATAAGSVFNAFQLKSIQPIRFSGSPSANYTVDPNLKWDQITSVERLASGATTWEPIPPPATGWMNSTGFVGTGSYEFPIDTVAVRLVVQENAAARQPASGTDPTEPKQGEGVYQSAAARTMAMNWQLRDYTLDSALAHANDPASPLVWITQDSAAVTCNPVENGPSVDGCIDNTFQVIGNGNLSSDTARDFITVINATTNTQFDKRVQALNPAGTPIGAASEQVSINIPDSSVVDADDYPQVRYTLAARNASGVGSTPGQTSPEEPMKLAKLRVMDPVIDTAVPVPMGTAADELFNDRTFADEAATNPFNEFTLKAVRFNFTSSTIPAYLDPLSPVTLWLLDDTTSQQSQEIFTLQEVLDNEQSFLDVLPNVIGIAATYSSIDIPNRGNQIPAGVPLSMVIDTQLRERTRHLDQVIINPAPPSTYVIENSGAASGWDAIVHPSDTSIHADVAGVELRDPTLSGALANKTISVLHGTSRNQTIYEPYPDDPVRVSITAESAQATAPIQELRIEDAATDADNARFWELFEVTSFETPLLPVGADQSRIEILVNGSWVEQSVHLSDGGSLADAAGVAVVFTSSTGLFPTNSPSWSSSWDSASLPFNVVMRESATDQVNWLGDSVNNRTTVTVTRGNDVVPTNSTPQTVYFTPGTHQLTVQKHAPSQNVPNHPVAPLSLQNWVLEFTNSGNSFIPITEVTDYLPADLEWDGTTLLFTSTGVSPGRIGLTSDASEVQTAVSTDGQEISFTWPEGQRMYPGETMRITLGLQLLPVEPGVRVVNRYEVETGVDLNVCSQPTTNGQSGTVPSDPNKCSNTNFVTLLEEIGITTIKAVNGEAYDTLGEDYVNGAMNALTGEECVGQQIPFFSSDYSRYPCASYTAIGATDKWSLVNVNTGDTPLTEFVVVDTLPRPGDRYMFGGQPRQSTFTTQLIGDNLSDAFTYSGLHTDNSYVMEVSTDPDVCLGPVQSVSLWEQDPTCSDTATNPANSTWQLASQFTADFSTITAVRWRFDLSEEPLQPTQRINIDFETVNIAANFESLSLENFQRDLIDPENEASTATRESQYAWNQNGIIAFDENENSTNPLAPYKAGVVIETTELVLTKTVQGDGAEFAPEFVTVELACTVPSGLEDGSRVTLDMGQWAQNSVPTDGTPVIISGLPVGTSCETSELGELGTYGEAGRSIEDTPGVQPAEDGASALVSIRVQEAGYTELNFTNTYVAGGIAVEKSVLSTNQYPVPKAKQQAEFNFSLFCVADWLEEPIEREFSVQGGKVHFDTQVPVGAFCTLEETGTSAAVSSSITIDGVTTSGTVVEDIEIVENGSFVLVTNRFVGVNLAATGSPNQVWLIAAGSVLLVGAAAAFGLARLKKRRQSSEQ